MIGLLIPILVAAVLLILLALWLKAGPATFAPGKEIKEDVADLLELHLELPPKYIVERIFDFDDLQFVRSKCHGRARRLFLQERKRLALSWMRCTRNELRRVAELHAIIVREDAGIDTAAEVRLALNYLGFLAMYWTLSCAVWLAGPFTVQAMIGLLLRVSDRIHLISNGIVQGIESDSLNKVRIAWAQKSGSR